MDVTFAAEQLWQSTYLTLGRLAGFAHVAQHCETVPCWKKSENGSYDDGARRQTEAAASKKAPCGELLDIVQQTIERFAERAIRLYEQGTDKVRTGEYIRRGQRWVRSGLGWQVGIKTILSVDDAIGTLPDLGLIRT